MSQYNSIIKELQVSRRVSQELAYERHHQEIQRAKIEKQLQGLRRSRRDYIDEQIVQSKLQYEAKLRQDTEVSQQHLNRKKRAATEKSKFAQQDFQRERTRLIQQRNNHDALDKQYRIIDKKLADLQTRSRIAEEDENRKLFQFNTRKNTLIKLLQQSKERQAYHFTNSKRLTAF